MWGVLGLPFEEKSEGSEDEGRNQAAIDYKDERMEANGEEMAQEHRVDGVDDLNAYEACGNDKFLHELTSGGIRHLSLSVGYGSPYLLRTSHPQSPVLISQRRGRRRTKVWCICLLSLSLSLSLN